MMSAYLPQSRRPVFGRRRQIYQKSIIVHVDDHVAKPITHHLSLPMPLLNPKIETERTERSSTEEGWKTRQCFLTSAQTQAHSQTHSSLPPNPPPIFNFRAACLKRASDWISGIPVDCMCSCTPVWVIARCPWHAYNYPTVDDCPSDVINTAQLSLTSLGMITTPANRSCVESSISFFSSSFSWASPMAIPQRPVNEISYGTLE